MKTIEVTKLSIWHGFPGDGGISIVTPHGCVTLLYVAGEVRVDFEDKMHYAPTRELNQKEANEFLGKVAKAIIEIVHR